MREREYNMDYLRIFACFMVIFLHVAAQNWSSVDVTSREWHVFNLYDTAVRSAVPLFVMLSGKLILSKNTEFSVKGFYQKNIKKLMVVYVAWSVFYTIDTIGISGLSCSSFSDFIAGVVKSKFHLWYLPAMISIYLLVPIFICLVRYEKGRYMPYACMIAAGWAVGKSLITILFPKSELWEILFHDFSYALSDLSLYFLLGYALDKYKEKFVKVKKRYLVAGILYMILYAAKIGEMDAIVAGKPKSLLYGHFALPVFLEAVLIFMLFLKLPANIKNRKSAGLIAKLSKYTLFVYLIHIFVLEHIKLWFGITTTICSPWISVPFLSIVVFAVCMAGAGIVEKIPVIGKWIM